MNTDINILVHFNLPILFIINQVGTHTSHQYITDCIYWALFCIFSFSWTICVSFITLYYLMFNLIFIVFCLSASFSSCSFSPLPVSFLSSSNLFIIGDKCIFLGLSFIKSVLVFGVSGVSGVSFLKLSSPMFWAVGLHTSLSTGFSSFTELAFSSSPFCTSLSVSTGFSSTTLAPPPPLPFNHLSLIMSLFTSLIRSSLSSTSDFTSFLLLFSNHTSPTDFITMSTSDFDPFGW